MGKAKQRQPNLFGDDSQQGDLFGSSAPVPARNETDDFYTRKWLEKVLSEARPAEVPPWNRAMTKLFLNIFAREANKLPPEEAQVYIDEFDREMKRLLTNQPFDDTKYWPPLRSSSGA